MTSLISIDWRNSGYDLFAGDNDPKLIEKFEAIQRKEHEEFNEKYAGTDSPYAKYADEEFELYFHEESLGVYRQMDYLPRVGDRIIVELAAEEYYKIWQDMGIPSLWILEVKEISHHFKSEGIQLIHIWCEVPENL